MSNYPTSKILGVIANAGDYSLPLATAEEAGTGHMSYETGFNIETATPLESGGVPPFREDFNGMANLFSQFLLWYQQGGVMRYDSSINYEDGNEVFLNRTKYRCLKANGPGSKVVLPGTDKLTWADLDTPSVIAGQVTAFYNCQIGGSDGRRLIPWGETVPDERYILCDGGSDGRGGKVPNLIGKFLLGSAMAQAGQSGGSETAETDSKVITGTVHGVALTVAQLPSHSHELTISSAGSHSHSRGSMNITGSLAIYDHPEAGAVGATGAFYVGRNYNSNTKSAGGDDWGKWFQFDASRSWSGYTSSEGSHSHGGECAAVGSGEKHSHGFTSAGHAHTLSVMPPFYRLAYFVKVPE